MLFRAIHESSLFFILSFREEQAPPLPRFVPNFALCILHFAFCIYAFGVQVLHLKKQPFGCFFYPNIPRALATPEKIPQTMPIMPRIRPIIEYLSKNPRFLRDTREEIMDTTAKTRLT